MVVEIAVSLLTSFLRGIGPKERTEEQVRELTQLAKIIDRHASGQLFDPLPQIWRSFLALFGTRPEPKNLVVGSLADRSPFAERFHDLALRIIEVQTKLRPTLSDLAIDAKEVAKFDSYLAVITSPDSAAENRLAARRNLDLFCASVIRPSLKQSEGESPLTQQVLPMALFDNVKGSFGRLARQANGTYEKGWYDACAVILRKLIESLIIKVFETKNVAHLIKDGNGNFFMLANLIAELRKKPEWGLGRNAKKAIDDLKKLGDLAAHARHFFTSKQDIKELVPDLRIAVEELIHQAELVVVPSNAK